MLEHQGKNIWSDKTNVYSCWERAVCIFSTCHASFLWRTWPKTSSHDLDQDQLLKHISVRPSVCVDIL